jgi:hypothetical protein
MDDQDRNPQRVPHLPGGPRVLATELRPPTSDGGEAIARLAVESGAAGVHLGGGCTLELLSGAPLLATALRLGLEIPTLTLPLPDRPLGAGKRVPRLAATDADERAAAIELSEQALGLASSFGARVAEVDFGGVFLAATPADFARHFARRACDPGEPGALVLQRALAERKALGSALVDACRWSAERLVRAAERAGTRLAVRIAATPLQAPTPRELGELRDTFGDALAPAWDPARLSVLTALGLPVAEARLKSLAEAAGLVIESDAVGLTPGYLPGLGVRAEGLDGLQAAAGAPRVITGGADSTDAEIAAAVARTS